MARRPECPGHGAAHRPTHPYPRTARVNAVLAEVIATALERLRDRDERLSLLTVTAVETAPDLRRANVLFASLSAEAGEALEQHRVELQAAIARGGRMRRTPTLRFSSDPAVSAGERVEEALRRVHRGDG